MGSCQSQAIDFSATPPNIHFLSYFSLFQSQHSFTVTRDTKITTDGGYHVKGISIHSKIFRVRLLSTLE